MKAKALTLWQPWATLLVTGVKQVETRSWHTRHTGLVYIHAALRPMRQPEFEFLKQFNQEFNTDIPEGFEHYPLGGIIGSVQLVGCKVMCNRSIGRTSDKERRLGLWLPGRFAWECRDPEEYDIIRCRGKQGLWEYENA